MLANAAQTGANEVSVRRRLAAKCDTLLAVIEVKVKPLMAVTSISFGPPSGTIIAACAQHPLSIRSDRFGSETGRPREAPTYRFCISIKIKLLRHQAPVVQYTAPPVRWTARSFRQSSLDLRGN